MEQHNIVIWNIPFYFFIFLGIFITFKFVFIFFFRAAFEPRFIFELTPFYIFSGMNNLQLLFLSLFVVAFDTYLHIKLTRKNLYRSFLPTSLMLAGLGLGITTKEISLSNFPHYLLFGLLLFTLIIDHRRTLILPETLPSEVPPKPQPLLQKIPLPFFSRAKPQPSPQAGRPEVSVSGISSVFGLFKRGGKTAKPDRVSVSGISSVFGLFKRGKKTARVAPSTVEKEKKPEFIEKPSSAEKTVEEITKETKPVDETDTQKPPPISEEKVEKIIDSAEQKKPEARKEESELLEKSVDTMEPSSRPGSIDTKERDLHDMYKVPPEFDKWMKVQEATKKKQDILIKDLQSNFENIQKGIESLKDELENISKERQPPAQKLETPIKMEEKRELKGDLLKRIKPPSYLTAPEKMADYKFEQKIPAPLSRKVHEKRKHDLLRARAILEGLEKKVEKLEQTHIG